MTNKEYQSLYQQFTFDTWDAHCPSTTLIPRLRALYSDHYDTFLKDLDFVAFGWPQHPSQFTADDWQALGDWLTDVDTERMEARHQSKHS